MKRFVEPCLLFAALLLACVLSAYSRADDDGNPATLPVRNGLVADNLSRVEYQAVLDALSRFDFYPQDFDISVVENEPRYRLVMSRGVGPAWRIRSNLTQPQLDFLALTTN